MDTARNIFQRQAYVLKEFTRRAVFRKLKLEKLKCPHNHNFGKTKN